MNSGEVWPSKWSQGERANAHARYGSGGYFTDIAPGSMSQEELSQALVLNPNTAHRFTNYIEVDPQKLQESGYSIVQSTDRPNVFVVHRSDEPLNQGSPSNIDIGSNDALTGHGQNPPYNPPSSGSGDDS